MLIEQNLLALYEGLESKQTLQDVRDLGRTLHISTSLLLPVVSSPEHMVKPLGQI